VTYFEIGRDMTRLRPIGEAGHTRTMASRRPKRDVADIVAIVEAAEPAPTKRGSYKK
jgi:hypothetical protein